MSEKKLRKRAEEAELKEHGREKQRRTSVCQK